MTDRIPRRRALVAALALGLALGAGARSVQAGARPRAGDRAPAFTLKTVDKGEARTQDRLLKDGSTRGAVMVFVSSKCPYVAQARQPLVVLFLSFGALVVFVGVIANLNDTPSDVWADATANYPSPVLRDEYAMAAVLYGAERTPEVFLID